MTLASDQHAHRDADFELYPPLGDWSLLTDRGPNVLVSGPGDAVHALVDAMTPYLPSPLHHVACDAGLTFPPGGGTLILNNLNALDAAQQQALLGWLDDPTHARTQVISISQSPLYPKVLRETFLDALYYRLNVIYLEVAPSRRG